MKRLSFLSSLMLVLLFFAKPAIGQGTNNWPTSLDGLAVKADTLYICADLDTIHPIELGYDVPGLRLHPSYGEWSLYAISDHAMSSDYAVVSKNGGAGNAFKVVGSGIGGYIFRYKAANTMCGLNVAESYFMYVFILPKLTSPIAADTSLCKQDNGAFLNASIDNRFPYRELYQKAKITATWTPSSFTNMRADSVSSIVYTARLKLTGRKDALGCGNKGVFNYTVNVLPNGFKLESVGMTICPTDTVGILAKRHPNVLFGRSIAGTYSPATIGSNWSSNVRKYTFSYVDCNNATIEVVDSLRIEPSPLNHNRGRDTLSICRDRLADTANLYTLSKGITSLSLLQTNARWADRGVTGTLPLVNGPTGSVFIADYGVDVKKMAVNIGYNFQYRMDPSTCFGGDTGLFILMLQDPFTAVDFRTQMCSSYKNSNFALDAFTGVENASWSYLGSLATNVGNIENNRLTSTQLTTMGDGTHKLQYTVAASCGGGGTGVMYIKIGGKASIPSSVSERYCKNTLPPTINVNEVLGFSGLPTNDDNKWLLSSVSNGGTQVGTAALSKARKYFSSITGVFDLSGAIGDVVAGLQLNSASSTSPLVLTFNLSGATCQAGGGASELRIVIVDNILIP